MEKIFGFFMYYSIPFRKPQCKDTGSDHSWLTYFIILSKFHLIYH